ncbi:Heterokaryon incompatibility protein 6, OR allele [Daldinia childiae]|uniref:Heterokaryon incompatibility protein 6, OR allele n=1 Tax=Daldinia childiae TaxID=326645 RepID=UPI0014451772|nr:Heterokaryon incompatibility protein 6, OR allele [Daldinia childiae]KAF3057024.1 Heterokaryon incompatibility protein 6, OR allele [Daldinia childiae]
MERYEYQHLPDRRSFRLLSLLPGNDPADLIRCQLQVHSLTEDGQIPQYTALSYVWGDPSFNICIECEGGMLPVNKGCFYALRALRDSLRDPDQDLDFTPYFWVDAVCINQLNDNEKSAQVRLMGDIFRLAGTVLCFIGDTYTQDNMYAPNLLGARAGVRKQLFLQSPRDESSWNVNGDIIGIDNLRESAIRKLVESQYWTRLWTFQEALLSHRKIVFSGKNMIEWEYVGTLLQQAAAKREGLNQSLPKAIHFHTLTTGSPILRHLLDRGDTMTTKPFSKSLTRSLSLEISRLLSFSSELRTSDPRDRLFALAGLMTVLEVSLEFIDYSTSMELVLANSIEAFSMHALLKKWVVRHEDVSFTYLDMGSQALDRSISLPIRVKGTSGMNQLYEENIVNHMRCSLLGNDLLQGKGTVEVPISKELPNVVQSKEAPSSEQEETEFPQDEDESDDDGTDESEMGCKPSTIIPNPMAGFGEQQHMIIRDKGLQDWKKIYQILFPNDDEESIPSQYYANIVTIVEMLEQFDRAYQQEVEQRLPGLLGTAIERLRLRPFPAIEDAIVSVVHEINSAMVNSTRQRMAHGLLTGSNLTPPEVSRIATPRVGTNLNDPTSFLHEYVNNINTGTDLPLYRPLNEPQAGSISNIDTEANISSHPSPAEPLGDAPNENEYSRELSGEYLGEPSGAPSGELLSSFLDASWYGVADPLNTTTHGHLDNYDNGVDLLHPRSHHGTYDETPDVPMVMRNGSMNDHSRAGHAPNEVNDNNGNSTNEWAMIETT